MGGLVYSTESVVGDCKLQTVLQWLWPQLAVTEQTVPRRQNLFLLRVKLENSSWFPGFWLTPLVTCTDYSPVYGEMCVNVNLY